MTTSPVEMALSPGWDKVGDDEYWLCTNARRHGSSEVMAAYALRASYVGACEACAQSTGAFASPEPKAEAAKPCADWCGTVRGCDGSSFCRAHGLEPCRCDSPTCRGRLAAKPAPVVEKPRPLTCSCGSVELVAMRFVAKGDAPGPMCSLCWAGAEKMAYSLMTRLDKLKQADPKPHHAAHPGVTPVVYGLSVGVWASRGMRSGR